MPSTRQTLETLYKSVEHMCLRGMAPTIYTRLRDHIQQHQTFVHDQLLAEDTPNHTAALHRIDGAWQSLCDQTVSCPSAAEAATVMM